MLTPQYKLIQAPTLLNTAQQLIQTGTLRINNENLVYLHVTDCFINKLYPLLTIPHVKKPNYLHETGIGAHISVIYPEEKTLIDLTVIGKTHAFSVGEVLAAKIARKTYYILSVKAPSLVALRQQEGLAADLNFRGYLVNLHITFAVKYG